MMYRLVSVAILLQVVTSLPDFQSKIPNGDNVPYPCIQGKVWNGVGPFLFNGYDVRNPFGDDFEAAGFQWTKWFCEKDSDGDGMTNGEELGDPECQWKEGETPKSVPAKSHPGICDPWNSPKCMIKNLSTVDNKYQKLFDWIKKMCKEEEFKCPALSEPDVKNLAVRLPPASQIQANKTSYSCHIYDVNKLGLPADQDFHLVGVTPIIDNKNFIHHINLFGCTDDSAPTDKHFECQVQPTENCMNFIHVWTVGYHGECFHPDAGVRIGLHGYKRLYLQIHYSNPQQLSDQTDSSGLRLHYTPNLRKFDSSFLLVGARYFPLLPRKPEVTVTSTCTSECTQGAMNGSVWITSALNHMHQLGQKMKVELWRNNKIVQIITNEQQYSFDSPVLNIFKSPLEVLPGDSIVSTCTYNTTERQESTTEEVCYGFLVYYPKRNMKLPSCIDNNGQSDCAVISEESCPDMETFRTAINTTPVYWQIKEKCPPSPRCMKECLDTIVKHQMAEPCLRGRPWKLVQKHLAAYAAGRDFLTLIAPCSKYYY